MTTDTLLLNLCDDHKRVIDRIDGEPETPDAKAQDEIHCALFDETANLRDRIAEAMFAAIPRWRYPMEWSNDIQFEKEAD